MNAKPGILTVNLEDYFQVAPLKGLVQTAQWDRFEQRVERNTRRTLDLLDEHGSTATFFVTGWIADELPGLVRTVVDRGHEIASKGYLHRSLRQLAPSEFRDDLLRSRLALEMASGVSVRGYRIAHGWFGPSDLWALDVLAEEDFVYDSSLRPLLRSFANRPRRRVPHLHRSGEREIWEFPLPSASVCGWSVPIAGGNWVRQFPPALMRWAARHWSKNHRAPFLFYFHVWELDPGQPRIRAAPFLERLRQYRNLERMEDIVRHYLEMYAFTSISEYLDLSPRPLAASSDMGSRRERRSLGGARFEAARRLPVTVVVPCYNEELIVPYLANTLRSVHLSLVSEYSLRYIFVDDGSTDGTWEALRENFRERSDCELVRQDSNRGVAAAILEGIRVAETEIICSIDCDCTYDPHQLRSLIPMLKPGVDLVTASPYHADGQVRNVPAWRLLLSRCLSRLYRWVLPTDLATYTSCFRVYRRESVAGLDVEESGYVGVAEMLGLLSLRGATIVEAPAVLDVRLLGRSKMKAFATIAGHLRLLARLGGFRIRGTFRSERRSPERATDVGSPTESPGADAGD